MSNSRLLFLVFLLLFFGCSDDNYSVGNNGFSIEGEFIETPYAEVENQGPYYSLDQFRVALTLSSADFRLGHHAKQVDFIYLVLLTDKLGEIADGQYSLSEGNLLNIIVATEYTKNDTTEDVNTFLSYFTKATINIQKSIITTIEYNFYSEELTEGEISGSFVGPITLNETFHNGQVSLNNFLIAPNYSINHGFIQKGQLNGETIFNLTLSNKDFIPGFSGSFNSFNIIHLIIEADENGQLSDKSSLSKGGFYSLGGNTTIANDNYDTENSEYFGGLHPGSLTISRENNFYKITSSNIKWLSSSNEPSHIGMSFSGELIIYE